MDEKISNMDEKKTAAQKEHFSKEIEIWGWKKSETLKIKTSNDPN